MDKTNPLSTPMMGRTLNVEKDPFRPKEENEEDLDIEVPYLSVIGALIWLRSVTQHIQGASGLSFYNNPTILYEDNAACVTQKKEDYIKSDRTKHMSPKFFSFTQELERNKEVDIHYIRSCDNVADLFTKTLPTSVFKKHVQSIGMHRLGGL
ncbi:hypothetical protein LIER_29294 [Lithospermum erythrorhizon]|uniref:Uncharacterized protein n=1 Tax=Lithospermum erythrorhizon TaxID=34254 RepID=A0AAV3RKA3_LITER